MVAQVTKAPIVHEDFALGAGKTAQQRGADIVQLQRVELNWIFRTTDEIRELDYTQYSRVSLHQNGALKEYWFSSSSSSVDDDDTIIAPTANPTLGRWVLVVTVGDYMLSTGAAMTGDLVWWNSTGTLKRIETIPEVDNAGNGFRFFDTAGSEAAFINVESSGSNANSSFLVGANGVFGFYDSQQSTGAYRFIIQGNNGADRKMVLGTPWDNAIPGTPTGKAGYNHLQLLFERDVATDTPFFQASTDGKLQMLIGGEGGALFSDAIEIRDYQDTDTFTYSIYVDSDTDNFGVDGICVIEPSKSIIDGLPTYYSSELHLRTNSTSGSDTGIKTFKFLEDGSLVLPGTLFVNQTLNIRDVTDTVDNGHEIFNNGFFDAGLGVDKNQLTIQPTADAFGVRSEVIIKTAALTGPEQTWWFQSDGDFICPGDIIIDSTGSNNGALEIRNIEAAGDVGWYEFYVTNAATPEATLIIEPSNERQVLVPDSGQYYNGEVIIRTSPTTGLPPGSGGVFHDFHFKDDGNLDIPGAVTMAALAAVQSGGGGLTALLDILLAVDARLDALELGGGPP